MSIDSGDILRMAVFVSGPENQTILNVLHYLASAGSGGDETTILGDLADNYETALSNLSAVVSNQYATYGSALWKWDTGLEKFIGVASVGLSGFTGGAAGDYLMAQAAPLVDFYVTTPKRKGAKYLWGFIETAVTYGSWSAGALAALALYAADVIASVVSDGVTLQPGVFSADDTSPYYGTFEAFTNSVGIETYSSTQRKRKPGVGI